MDLHSLFIEKAYGEGYKEGYQDATKGIESKDISSITKTDTPEGKEFKEIKVYLKQGGVFVGKYRKDEYEDIYDSWTNQYKFKFMRFENGEFLISEIIGIEWEV